LHNCKNDIACEAGEDMNSDRRKLLHRLASGGALAAVAPFLIRNALAMGSRIYPQGLHKLEGEVLLNNKPATAGAPVGPGDIISTGPNSLAIFVAGQDAYMLRGNSKLEISGAASVIKTLNLLGGKMLSVFGKGEKNIILPTATIGIRGTAVYAEAEAVRSYLCTCYGTVDIRSVSNPEVRETVVSRRHDAPRFIYASGEKLIARAPVINHTDDELFMLEALVGRLPKFFNSSDYQSNRY
jgi:hypothetical protein